MRLTPHRAVADAIAATESHARIAAQQIRMHYPPESVVEVLPSSTSTAWRRATVTGARVEIGELGRATGLLVVELDRGRHRRIAVPLSNVKRIAP